MALTMTVVADKEGNVIQVIPGGLGIVPDDMLLGIQILRDGQNMMKRAMYEAIQRGHKEDTLEPPENANETE